MYEAIRDKVQHWYKCKTACKNDKRQNDALHIVQTFCRLMAGLPVHKKFYESFITAYFDEPWGLPVSVVIVIVAFIIAASAAAVYAPSERIKISR